MAVLSKHAVCEALKSINDSVPYTCYEVAHTWTPYCSTALLDVAKDVMKMSFKAYFVFYLVTHALKIRKREDIWLQLKKLPQNIIRSTLFLTANGSLFLIFLCGIRHALGSFFRWHFAACGLFSGCLSILIERKSRRGMLAIYLLNLAAEILFNMAVSRNLIKSIPNGEVLIFSIATAGIMALYRTPGGLPKSFQNSVKYLVEKEYLNCKLLNSKRILKGWPCTVTHKLCDHENGCVEHVIKGGVQQFAMGYGIELIINVLRLIKSKGKRYPGLKKIMTQFSIAKFLGGFTFLYKLTNCLLCWTTNQKNPTLYGGIAGFVAGFSSYFYKSSTISLYLIFKLIEIIGLKGVKSGKLPFIPHLSIYIYSLSLAIIGYSAGVEPHTMRPSYFKFVDQVSGGRFSGIFRKLFDPFGANASKMFPNYIPNLDPNFVKSKDVIALLKKHGKWIV